MAVPVTSWARKVKQPYGGYLKIKSMHRTRYDDGIALNPDENLNPGTVGTAVDYLSRYLAGCSAAVAFELPLAGAESLGMKSRAEDYIDRLEYMKSQGRIDDEFVRAGVNLTRFDAVVKAYNPDYGHIMQGELVPSLETAHNIRVMLSRILNFREMRKIDSTEGEVLRFSSESENIGFDVMQGEPDIYCNAGIWDCKALSQSLRATHSIQLLAYYVMAMLPKCGMRTGAVMNHVNLGFMNPNLNGPGDFVLGFFNPRSNEAHETCVSELDKALFGDLIRDMSNPDYLY